MPNRFAARRHALLAFPPCVPGLLAHVGLLAHMGLLGLLTACDGNEALPEVSRVRHRRLTQGRSAVPWPVTVEGRGFATSARAPLAFELLRVEPPWPRVRVALTGLRLESATRARAEMPAGTHEGTYRLVVRRGRRWRLAPHRIRVEPHRPNSAPVTLASLRTLRSDSGEGGRLLITGANLALPVLVTLHGPVRRSTALRSEVRRPKRRPDPAAPPRVTVPGVTEPRRPSPRDHQGHGHGEDAAKRAQVAARAVAKTPRPRFTPLQVTELSAVYEVHGTRMLARLPRDLAPGRYYVQVYTSTHRGNEPDRVYEVAPAGPGHPRLWHVLWLGLLLAGALLGVACLRRRRRIDGRVALLVIGAAVACVAPLAFLG